MTAWSFHLTHCHYIFLAFVATLAWATGLASFIARALFRCNRKLFVAIVVGSSGGRRVHDAVFQIVCGLVDALPVEIIVLLWLVAGADGVCASITTVWAIVEAGAGGVACWKRLKMLRKKVTYRCRRSSRFSRSQSIRKQPCRQGSPCSNGHHKWRPSPRR